MRRAIREIVLLAAFGAAGLSACSNGSNAASFAPPPAAKPDRTPKPGTQTFNYTGGAQKFKVPRGVNEITITAYGASGGASASGPKIAGGTLTATIPVMPREKLFVYVGGAGASVICSGSGGDGIGGFNGGANGGIVNGGTYCYGAGGGGASDVRAGGKALANRVIVAGGAGGDGSQDTYASGPYLIASGGAGGGSVGGSGSEGYTGLYGSGDGAYGGTGGSQTSGGSGGGGYGSVGTGANGAIGVGGTGGSNYSGGHDGGGGGGGYYGGGGGGATGYVGQYSGGGGGGGGGSSYAEPSATGVTSTQGTAPTGNGQIVISWQ